MKDDLSKAGVIGWDGDNESVICYLEGDFFIRDGRNILVEFEIGKKAKHIEWYNEEGFLPCLVTEFEYDECDIKIKHFADKISVNNRDYVAVYSRVEIKNNSDILKHIDIGAPKELIALNNVSKSVLPNESAAHDFVIISDRFGNFYGLPSDEELISLGGFDTHFNHMREYWLHELSNIADIELPDTELIESYRANFIYTQIIKNKYDLYVGANGYEEVFDHDAIGILVNLFTQGYFKDAGILLSNLKSQIQYDDAKFKISWPFALYYLKTGDKDILLENFDKLKYFAHEIEKDIDEKGIIKQTWDIDRNGYWTVDNWSALLGLCAYMYIAKVLGEENEYEFAKSLYDGLLLNADRTISETVKKYKLDYIPASMTESNDNNICRKPRNTNWASMFLFGRWAWDGYLFDAKQYGYMIDMIDATYDYGLKRGREAGLFPHSFGGGSFSDSIGSYNAGLAATGLRGKKYRCEGIYAYQAMLSYGQSGPYSFWESAGEPVKEKWSGYHPVSGDGSCPHMWGQNLASKVLLESLIAQKYDKTLLIGRGIPEEWLYPGKKIRVDNFPIQDNKRFGFEMEALNNNILCFKFRGEHEGIIIDIPCFLENIDYVSEGIKDNGSGRIILDKNTTELKVRLVNINFSKNLLYRKGVRSNMRPSDDGNFLNCTNGSLADFTMSDSPGNHYILVDIGKPVKVNRICVFTDDYKYAKKFNIDFSVDGKEYITYIEENKNNGKPKSYIFETAITRYIRYTPMESVGEDEKGGHRLSSIECYYDEV